MPKVRSYNPYSQLGFIQRNTNIDCLHSLRINEYPNEDEHKCLCEHKKMQVVICQIRIQSAVSPFLEYTFCKWPIKMSRKEALSQFINQIHGRPVVVKLNSGVDYRGVLACLDGYMNIALDQTEEYVNGQLKNKYGDAFIRGNNVLYISTQKRRV